MADEPKIDTRPPQGGLSNFIYRAFFVCGVIAALILIGFFCLGLVDGSVSAFNIGLWLGLLAGVTVVLWGGRTLRANGYTVTAVLLLGIIAVPGLLYALFIVLLLFSGTNWN